MELLFSVFLNSIHSIYSFYIKEIQYNIMPLYKHYVNIFINTPWDQVSNVIYVYFFFLILISSICVLLSKNPIHSVFFLIVVFLHVGFLLLLLHVEFLAFLIFIVYLGAIAVLFLFVIMMFNIHILETRDNIIRYIPLVFFIFIITLEMSYITEWLDLNGKMISFREIWFIHKNWYNLIYSRDNIVVLSIIYSYYFYHFILASLILLVAMIGAIILTLNSNIDLKKQLYYMQNTKKLYNSVVLKRKSAVRLQNWVFFLRKRKKKIKINTFTLWKKKKYV